MNIFVLEQVNFISFFFHSSISLVIRQQTGFAMTTVAVVNVKLFIIFIVSLQSVLVAKFFHSSSSSFSTVFKNINDFLTIELRVCVCIKDSIGPAYAVCKCLSDASKKKFFFCFCNLFVVHLLVIHLSSIGKISNSFTNLLLS